MTNTIIVPRDLLERIVGKCKLSVLGDDHAKVWELLSAPAVEVEGLEVVGYADAGDIKHQCHGTLSPYQWQRNNVRLTEYNKAQAIIDQQAARIAELQKDAARWQMFVNLCNEAMVAPDYRRYQKEWLAYRDAIADGYTASAAVDVAMEVSDGN